MLSNRYGRLRGRPKRRRATAPTALRVEPLETRHMLAANLVISEFMASNDRTLDDGDGKSSDWIEIHNSGDAAANLQGWFLTDDPTKRDKWPFPDVVIDAGGYLVVFASGQDVDDYVDFGGKLHTNFKLNASGEYLALIDSQRNVVHQFAPTFSQQYEDISYGLRRQKHSLVSEGDRLTYLVPTEDLPMNWTQTSFDDSSWNGVAQPVTTGLGFRTNDATLSLREAFDADTEAFPGLSDYPNWSFVTDARGTASVEDGVLRLDRAGPGKEHMRITTPVSLDRPFTVQSRVGRATGGSTVLNNIGMAIGNVTAVFHPGSDGGAFRFGTVTGGFLTNKTDMGFTPAAGELHEMEVIVTPTVAGWQLEVKVTDASNPDNVFTSSVSVTPADIGGETIGQIGLVRNGGSGADGIFDDFLLTDGVTVSRIDPRLIETDVLEEMHDVNASIYLRQSFTLDAATLSEATELKLGVRYDDGFVAFLNGYEIARRNATALPDVRPAFDASATTTRADEEANLLENIDISPYLDRLQVGENVLAIQALNKDAGDNDFLISTRLVAGTTRRSEPLYFSEPTPGAENALGFVRIVRDNVRFTHPGGTFVDAFSLKLATDVPNSDIFYTIDGSVPTDQSTRYREPIPISATTQVRSRVIAPGSAPGPINTESFVRLRADAASFSSRLPIMVIDNFGAGPIPNKGFSRTGAGIQLLPRQAANLMLFEPNGGVSNVNGLADLSFRVGIRVRGAFSSSWPEPGYSVESWGAGNDEDVDVAPLGMTAESDWVLYAPNPDHDRSLLDNTFLFELSNQMGHWATKFRYVEAFVNTDGGDVTMDDFVGLYVLEEKVKRGRDRVDFERFSPDASSGGWLLNVNRMDAISLEGELPKNFHTAGRNGTLRTPRDLSSGMSRDDDIPRENNAYINFDNPNGYEVNEVQRQAIEGSLKQMEDVLYDRTDVPWNDPRDGYAKYIDVDSFIDYFILNNLSKNGDGLGASYWLYNPDPNRDGKLTFGPIWDADIGSFSGDPSTSLMYRANKIWYARLFSDPNFMQAYIDRWQTLRDGPLSEDNIEAIIDDLFTEIGNDAALRDGVDDWPARISSMKTWLIDRTTAIDDTFISRPAFNRRGGSVPVGFPLEIASREGEVFYTTDGTDPRLPNGSMSAGANMLGLDAALNPVQLVSVEDPASALIPTAAIDALIGNSWTTRSFVEGGAGETWTTGTTGIGYVNETQYDPLIGLNVGDVDASAYARIEFDIEGTVPAFDVLTLNMQYDDGFVAYLNGREVARVLAPGNPGEPVAFDANSTDRRSSTGVEGFDISAEMDALHPGRNLLAIHGLNRSESDSDMLILPGLVGSFFRSAAIVIDKTSRVTARTWVADEWSGPTSALFTAVDQVGDFNGDNLVNAADVDLLCAAIHDNDANGDLNGDGTTGQPDLEFLVQNVMGTNMGDANLDGIFDSSDLVLVLASGQYKDDVARNSTWAMGDWNCDGEFDTSDLAAALQAGGYEAIARSGPRD